MKIKLLMPLFFLTAGILCAEDLLKTKIIPNFCAGECCQFGKWKSRSPQDIPLYSKPKGNQIVGLVKPGMDVLAITGEIHRTPRKIILDAAEGGLESGDVVYLLGEASECGMAYRALRNGKVVKGEDCLVGDIDIRYGSGRVDLWWVKLRTESGIEGWTDQPEHFSGRDSCS